MNRYTYNGEVLELTDIAEEGLVSLIGFHDLFRQYEEQIEQLLGMHEEGMMLLMLILDMKQNGKLSHNTYPTILHPVIDNLINEMFTLIDLCSGMNIEVVFRIDKNASFRYYLYNTTLLLKSFF